MGKNSWWKVEEGTALLFIVKVIIALQVSAPPFACLKSKRLDNVTGSEVMLRVLHRVTHQGQPQKCERIGALAGRSPCILSGASYNLPCADSFKHRLREIQTGRQHLDSRHAVYPAGGDRRVFRFQADLTLHQRIPLCIRRGPCLPDAALLAHPLVACPEKRGLGRGA